MEKKLPCDNGVEVCTVDKTVIQHWEKQYRTLVNALFPNFIFVFDEDFHFVEIITPDELRLFHTREELLGKDARIFYPPEVSELYIANIRECLRTKQWREVEYYMEMNGTHFFYQARLVPLDDNRVFCLVQDIWDRVRRMEELITERRRAVESDRMKSAFIANISHEMRTPLNAILSFSEFLMNEEIPENRQNHMNIIRSSNALLQNIISDILELSRLDAGMSEFSFEETDIVALMMEVSEIHKPSMKLGVQLLTDIPKSDIRVPTDANRVKQVLHNLITNAKKFTEKGSILLKVEEGDENLTFSVSDTGCGIPEDKLATIFERFEKLHRFVQGTGLGMAICKSIVERLGGEITVTSKIKEGSVFSFTIPYCYVALQKKDIGNIRELSNQRKKILVVETSEDDIQYIHNILTIKYDVVEITHIEKIISAFILDQPDLVLMSMQVVDKIDIVTKIRAISPTIPIIVMTTNDFYHDQRWAIENGCTDFIAKPFSPSKLEEVVMAFIV